MDPEHVAGNRPDECPACGTKISLARIEVAVGGSWCTSDRHGKAVTGGHNFLCRCPNCGIELMSFPSGFPTWEQVDRTQVLWYPQNPKLLRRKQEVSTPGILAVQSEGGKQVETI